MRAELTRPSVPRRRPRDERGVSTVIMVVSLLALFSAAVLSIDSGSLWATRRALITATDAAALDAAALFNNGGLDPCDTAAHATAETHALNVLTQNDTRALHNSTETPDGFAVTPFGTCGTGGYMPGKVRFDGRLPAHLSFSSMFGFNESKPISSSTAAWGYIVEIGEGLRPFAVCDQHAVDWSLGLPPPGVPAGFDAEGIAIYPQFHLWNEYWWNRIDIDTYNSYFGSSPAHPIGGFGFDRPDLQNPNEGVLYVTPSVGSSVFTTVHRITMPDGACGVSPGNRTWVDFTGAATSGNIGADDLRQWILDGYPGSVALEPHDCNPADEGDVKPENCGGKPGDNSNVTVALRTITCRATTPALECPYRFPIVVVDSVTLNGSNVEYDQVAFLFVVLRGFGDVNGRWLQFDFEFVKMQAGGRVAGNTPSGSAPAPTGIQLCGADHDASEDRCF